jgi:signal transduction histidine kinase/ligand-binding sensor domain-containing protein
MSRLTFILLIVIAHGLRGQSNAIYNYSIAEGLPSNEVYEVFQDRNHFMWFATDNGVVKFDGKEMEVFNTKDGLSDPVVFGFSEDYSGRIWFRSYSGRLSYYENGKIKKHHGKIKTPNVSYSIYCDQHDTLWISGNGFIAKISNDSIQLKPLEKGSVTYTSIGSNYLLASHSNSNAINAIIIDKKTFPITVSDTITYNGAYCAAHWNGSLFLSIGRDIFKYDGIEVSKIYTSNKLIINLSKDQKNNLWIGFLGGGTEKHSTIDLKNPWSFSPLNNKSVTEVVQDHEGGYWFSTLENGVYFIPSLTIKNYPLNISSKIKTVNVLKDLVVIGEFTGGLCFIDIKTKQTKRKQPLGEYFLTTFVDSKENLWVSSQHTIVFDENLKITFTDKGSNVNFSEDDNGSIYGVTSSYINNYDLKEKTAKHLRIKDVYRTIYADDSILYLGGTVGLHILTKNRKVVSKVNEFANIKITNILSLTDSTLLISTSNNGFLILIKKDNKIKYHSLSKFLPRNIYSTLITDSLLWISTERGLAYVNKFSLLRGEDAPFTFLTKKNGLHDNFINFLAFADNHIWAFSNQGYSCIPASFNKTHIIPPSFYIKKFLVNSRDIDLSSSPILSHYQNNIEITFGYIGFSTDQVLVRYRLNKDNPWIETNTRKIQFASLAPDAYLFELEFSTNGSQWIQALKPIPITIKSPWWTIEMVYLAALILLLTIVCLYVKHKYATYKQKNQYLKVINEHQQKLIQSEIVMLERERNRIAKELHDGVGTNLTAIKLMINQLLKHNNNEPLAANVEEQFQIALQEIKDIIYALTPPSLERYGLFAALTNYISKLNKNIPSQISIQTFGQEVNHYELNIIIFRVIQELLSNSIKHSHAKNINIHLNSFEDLLNIVYEDNGIGFSKNPAQSGLGLDNIESRIQSMHGILKFDSGDFGVSYNIDIPLTIKQK